MTMILWGAVLAAHVLSMAYWIGGGLFVTLTTRSSLSLLEAAQRQNILLQLYSRYCRILMHVAPVCLISGWLLIIHIGGFASVPWTVNAMQALGIVMMIVLATIISGPLRAARRAIRPQPALFDAIRKRILLMTGVGILTSFFAALTLV